MGTGVSQLRARTIAALCVVFCAFAHPALAADAEPCNRADIAVAPLLQRLDAIEHDFQPWGGGELPKATLDATLQIADQAQSSLKSDDVCLARILNETAVIVSVGDQPRAADLIRKSFAILENTKDHRQLLWEVANNVWGLAEFSNWPGEQDRAFVDKAVAVADRIEAEDGVDYEGLHSVKGLRQHGLYYNVGLPTAPVYLGPGAGALLLETEGDYSFHMLEDQVDANLSAEPELAQALVVATHTLPPDSKLRTEIAFDYGSLLAVVGGLTDSPAKFQQAIDQLEKLRVAKSDIDDVVLERGLAVAYLRAGRNREAVETIERLPFANRPLTDEIEAQLGAGDGAGASATAAAFERALTTRRASAHPTQLNAAGVTDNFFAGVQADDLGALADTLRTGDARPLARAVVTGVARTNLLTVITSVHAQAWSPDIPAGAKASEETAGFSLEWSNDASAARAQYEKAASLSAGGTFERWARLGSSVAEIWTLQPGATCPNSGLPSPSPAPDRLTYSQNALVARRSCDLLVADPEHLEQAVLAEFAPPAFTLAPDLNAFGAAEYAAGRRDLALASQLAAVDMTDRYASPHLEFLQHWSDTDRQQLDEVQRAVGMMADAPVEARSADLLERVWRVKSRSVREEDFAQADDQRLQAYSSIAEYLTSHQSADLSRADWQELNRLLAIGAALTVKGHPGIAGVPVPPRLTTAQAQSHLPADAALLEFVRYPVFDLRMAFGVHAARQWNYAVAVLRPSGAPVWRDLGKADEIDAQVDRLRFSVANGRQISFQRQAPVATDQAQVRTAVETRLYQLLVQPVLADIGKADTLLIAPDGALDLLPFSTLKTDDGQYLVRKYKLAEVDSETDLSGASPATSQSPPFIVAAPDFGSGGDRRLCGSTVQVSTLAGASDEAQKIGPLLPGAVLRVGVDATKAALFAVHGPRVLHIATHGFFCGKDQNGGLSLLSTSLDDPLLRSGLVFAGANAQSPGNAHALATALELSTLDLRGTQLVVLAACQTGVGDVSVGQGVIGMRRVLSEAGAQSEILSLWDLADDVPARFMVVFYRELAAGKSRIDAFHDAQLDLIGDRAYADPSRWAAFTFYGQWGPLKLN